MDYSTKLFLIYIQALINIFIKPFYAPICGIVALFIAPILAFKDMDEFIANAYNTVEFQKFLAGERSVVPNAPSVNSLWTDFLNFVKQLLNLGDVSNTLLSDVVGLTPDLFTGTREVGSATIPDFTPQDKMFARDNNEKAAQYFKNTNIKTEKVVNLTDACINKNKNNNKYIYNQPKEIKSASFEKKTKEQLYEC